MDHGYVLLIEKEEMWAKMLMEVLLDNGIPCVKQSVYGAGFVLKTGTLERFKVFVPKEYMEQASELVQELFSEEATES